MAGEIGQAFVRIRPNTRGFQSETEHGVKGTFEKVAKLAGLAFGAKEGIDFVREIAHHAADAQKQTRAVQAEFGAAAEEIKKFAETTAASLGISEHAADTTAARFGIIFRNLGIGQEQAAGMTIGFEKLAGSLALIRNVDPSVVLKNIPLAVQGNLRSLKQLGIATDQNQLKLAALKLGLISNIKEGLTPSIRAQAIYAVATAHLGDYLAQAGVHAGDAASQEIILAAAWDNAKDKLGVGLLPTVTKLTTFLAANLPSAVDKTIATFHRIKVVVTPLINFLGGLKNTIKDLVIAWLAWKAVTTVSGIVLATERVIVLTKVMWGAVAATEAEAAAAKVLRTRLLAIGALGIITVTVIVAEKVAASIKKLQQGEITAKEAPALVPLRVKLVPKIADEIKAAKAAGDSSKNILARLRTQLGGSLKADDIIAQAFEYSASNKDASRIEDAWKKALADPAKKGLKDGADELRKQLKAIPKVVDPGLKAAQAALLEMGRTLADAITQQTKDVHDAVESAKANLVSIGQSLSDAIGSVLDKPLQNEQDKISRLANRKSLEDLRRSVLLPGGKTLATDPKKGLAQLESLARATGNVNRGAIQAFILQYRSALLSVRQDQVNVTKETTQRRIADLTDSFNRGEIGLGTYKKRILGILTSDHVSYKKAGQLLGTAFANGFRDQVAGLLGQAGAITATPAKFGAGTTGTQVSIVKPLETLHTSQENIGKLQREISQKQTAIQTRIEKNTAKAAAAAKKSADLQQKLNDLVLNTENAVKPKTDKGKASKTATELSGAH